ncbi:MAG TPA: hypothetical protein VJY66_01760 [Acholeplasma sp.]|nr:hypothetical protein [Acholeplasma sp.]
MSINKNHQTLINNKTVDKSSTSKSKFVCISNLDDVDAAFYQPILGYNDAIRLDLHLNVFENIIGDMLFNPTVITKLGFLSTKYCIDELLRKKTASLTTFEQARVKIVKALINDNSPFVFTNPTKDLDVISSKIICKYLKDLTLEDKTVIVFSTQAFVKNYSDINYQLIDYALVAEN